MATASKVYILSKTLEDLVGYCGLYCGACGIYQGRIEQAIQNLRDVIGAFGFDKIAPELAKWEPAFQHYSEFEKVLDGFVRLLGECPECVAGGGDPGCPVRGCCKPKAFQTCAECDEMDTCDMLQRVAPGKKGLRKIKDIGMDKWIEEMQRKVSAGYCYLDERPK